METSLKLLLTLTLLLSISACAANSPSGEAPESPVSQADTAPVVSASPSSSVETAQRVVALTSLSADIIQRLDASRLVGIPGSRLLSEDDRFADFPQVSSGRTPPSLEQIVALKPDLVIGADGFHDQTLTKLQELGIKTLSTEVDSLQQLEALTQTLAEKIGADPVPVLAQFKACQVKPDSPPGQARSVLTLVSHQPILAPNKNSWAGNLLDRAGFSNPVANLQSDSPIAGYVTLSAEQVLTENPDLVIVVDADQQTLNALKAQPFWRELKAIQAGQLHVLDYYGLVNPGSVDKIVSACKALRTLG